MEPAPVTSVSRLTVSWEPLGSRQRLRRMNTFVSSFLATVLLVSTAGVSTIASEPTTATGDPNPVYLDSTQILYLESYPVQVNLLVRGSLPTPCHQPLYEVRDLGDSIDVLLWSQTDPDQICIQVLEPFELVIPLGSFESADMPVFLNGEKVGQIEIGTGSGEPALLGSGWSFGMCLGYCLADLAIEGDDLRLSGRGYMDETPLYANRGTLTSDGRAQLRTALAALDGAALEPVYGCPDCADGGAAYLELALDGTAERVAMEFGDPPPVLADLYGISASLMSALETCSSSPLVKVANDCVAYQTS